MATTDNRTASAVLFGVRLRPVQRFEHEWRPYGMNHRLELRIVTDGPYLAVTPAAGDPI